jgi:hypothetical protein
MVASLLLVGFPFKICTIVVVQVYHYHRMAINKRLELFENLLFAICCLWYHRPTIVGCFVMTVVAVSLAMIVYNLFLCVCAEEAIIDALLMSNVDVQ